jgi:long-chain fatty acid transport protein
MCFAPYCLVSEFNFSGTLFTPDVEGEIRQVSGTTRAKSDKKTYAIPAIGISVPITKSPQLWRFGLAAYGVSGLGVDYRDTDLDNPIGYDLGPGGTAPLIAGEFTTLQIMKFAPAVAYQPRDNLSLGLALHIDYATLDLRDGTSFNYAYGLQLGLIYALNDNVSLGLTYVTPQSVSHERVNDFDGDGTLDTLKLEAPQQVGAGAAYQIAGARNILVEANVKWINWSDADGYSDFDWDDQWVYAVGVQIEPLPKLFLRAGYNYGDNPVKENNGFDGSFDPGTGFPNSTKSVQGKTLSTYYYETFRIIGFPAIIKHHLTLGIGYEFSRTFAVHLGYMHGFEETISERGTDLFGQPVKLVSKLREDSIDFGLTWRF